MAAANERIVSVERAHDQACDTDFANGPASEPTPRGVRHASPAARESGSFAFWAEALAPSGRDREKRVKPLAVNFPDQPDPRTSGRMLRREPTI